MFEETSSFPLNFQDSQGLMPPVVDEHFANPFTAISPHVNNNSASALFRPIRDGQYVKQAKVYTYGSSSDNADADEYYVIKLW